MSAIAFLAALLLVLAVLAGVWVAGAYNRLVSLGRKRDEAWSGVLVQLKRRRDLVPNLVAVVSGYAAHEKSVLEEVARLRAPSRSEGPREVAERERDFSQSLVRLFAVAENYPRLRADGNFLSLQNALVRIEDDIQMSRRYYNGTVRNYNTLVATFPSMFVARRFSFGESPFFDLESPREADTPTVSFSAGG